jgi:hypothetical protein
VNNFVNVGAAGAGAAAVGAARQGGAAGDFLNQGGAAQQPARNNSVGVGAPGVGVGPGVGVRPGVGVGAPGVGARPGVGVGAPGVGRPGTPGQNLAQNRPGRIENRGERQGERDQRRDEVRNQYNENNPGNFWQENPGWAAYAVTRPLAWASWGSVGSWCGTSGEEAPYSYGEEIYYAEDQVYSGDKPIATAEEYSQQAEELATSDPTAEPAKGDWLPLGVFAITQDGQASGAAPSLYVQLAISKQGVISGTLKNTLSGKAQAIEGMADIKSQRVAWGVSGQERPIMETGLAGLTKDTAPALIHFADGQTQQWLIVRMPEQGEAPKK